MKKEHKTIYNDIAIVSWAKVIKKPTTSDLAYMREEKIRNSGFSDKRLEAIGQGLKPGSSAILAVVRHTWVEKVEQVLAQAQAEVTTAEIRTDITEQLKAGHDVAFTVITSQEDLVACHLAGNEGELVGNKLVIDERGAYGVPSMVFKLKKSVSAVIKLIKRRVSNNCFTIITFLGATQGAGDVVFSDHCSASCYSGWRIDGFNPGEQQCKLSIGRFCDGMVHF